MTLVAVEVPRSARKQARSQQLWCHARCLGARLHESAVFNAASFEAEDAATVDEAESYSDDDNDDDYDDETWLDTLCSSWRQHCVALLVAFVAAVLSFYYQRLALSQVTVTREAAGRSLLLAPTPYPAGVLGDRESESFEQPAPQQPRFHPHLRDFRRTSNISFCGKWTDEDDNFLTNEAKKLGLELMDFNVPRNLIKVMESYFEADNWSDEIGDKSDEHPEVKCMKQRSENSTRHPFIKGALACLYQPRSCFLTGPTCRRHRSHQ